MYEKLMIKLIDELGEPAGVAAHETLLAPGFPDSMSF